MEKPRYGLPLIPAELYRYRYDQGPWRVFSDREFLAEKLVERRRWGCIEVATGDYGIMIRDSKDRGGPTLKFTADSWVSLLDALKSEGSLVLSD